MEVRYGMVFRVDGLDLEGVCEDLKKYGNITEIMDNKLDGEDVKIIFMSSTFGKFFRVKLEYNAVPAEDNDFILFPMESRQAYLEVMRARK